MEKKKGFLLVLSGPSGVGKGTIVKEILKDRDDAVISISVTTRYKRETEEEGKDYFFVSLEKFNEMVKNHELIEFAEVHSNYYGTPKAFVEENIEKGNVVILEIDVQGAQQIRESFDDAVYVFVLPPRMKDIELRLRHRNTEDDAKISLRLENAKKEFNQIKKYDYFLLNDQVTDATIRLQRIIDEEREIRRNRNDKSKL